MATPLGKGAGGEGLTVRASATSAALRRGAVNSAPELSFRVHGQRMSNGPCFPDASTYISPPARTREDAETSPGSLSYPQIRSRSAKLGVGPRPNVIACM